MQFVEISIQSPRYKQEIELRDRTLRAPLGLVFTQEDLQAEVDHLHYGIVDGDALVACAVVVPLSTTEAKLRQMAVTEAHQRQGIGSTLVRSIEAELVALGFRHIQLNARDIAVGFYTSLGYAKEGAEFIEVSIPHRKMVKSIAVR